MTTTKHGVRKDSSHFYRNSVALSSKSVASANTETKYVKPDNEIAPPFEVKGWGFELLPVLGVFGANASGKSNVLRALDCLLDLMRLGSAIISEHLKTMQPFMFSSSARTAPTRFELRLVFERTVYTYSLQATRERIRFESLYYAPVSSKRESLLYRRSWNEIGQKYEWKNGANFAGPHTQLENSLADTDTFMSLLTRLNVPVTNPLNHWLMYRGVGVGHTNEWLDNLGAARTGHEAPAHLEKVSTVVRLFDTGITLCATIG